MEDTMYQRYEHVLEAMSFLRDMLYNMKANQEESRQEELVRQAEDLIQEAFELYKKTQERKR